MPFDPEPDFVLVPRQIKCFVLNIKFYIRFTLKELDATKISRDKIRLVILGGLFDDLEVSLAVQQASDFRLAASELDLDHPAVSVRRFVDEIRSGLRITVSKLACDTKNAY
jgi:hypothetical protein